MPENGVKEKQDMENNETIQHMPKKADIVKVVSSAEVLSKVQYAITILRGKQVLLDFQLAELYGVETKRLNEAVKRNIQRFPEDFMFRVSKEELANIRSQFATTYQQLSDNEAFSDFRPIKREASTIKGQKNYRWLFPLNEEKQKKEHGKGNKLDMNKMRNFANLATLPEQIWESDIATKRHGDFFV